MENTDQNTDKPTHPIHHHPTELLQYIFELAVEQNQEGFKMATSISHVCQRWRNISLDISALWTYVKIPVQKDASSEKEFLDRMQRRIRERPSVISISNIRDVSSCWIECDTFEQFMHIERLVFQVRNNNGLQAFRLLVRRLPPDISKSIDLKFQTNSEFISDGSTHHYLAIWELNEIIDRFSPPRLFICNSPSFYVANNPKWSRVSHLVLKRLNPLNLIRILRFFVGVKELEIIETGLLLPEFPDNRGTWTCNLLRRLKLWQVSDMYLYMAETLEKMSCPELTTLEVDVPADTNGIPSFLSRHPLTRFLSSGLSL